MNVNELLDTIEDALEEGANVPLSGGKKIVDVEQIRDYLDEIRANLPGELRQAQQIVTDYCDNMLKNTEETMVENAAQVKNVRANLRQNAKKNG